MHDPLRVRELDDLADAHEDSEVLLEKIARSLRARPLLVEAFVLPRRAANAPHDDDRAVVAPQDVVDWHDPWMFEEAGDPCLLKHPSGVLRRRVGERRLDRDGTLERALDRAPHDTHAALTDDLADGKRGDRRDGVEGRTGLAVARVIERDRFVGRQRVGGARRIVRHSLVSGWYYFTLVSASQSEAPPHTQQLQLALDDFTSRHARAPESRARRVYSATAT